jgi:hypothetical protein
MLQRRRLPVVHPALRRRRVPVGGLHEGLRLRVVFLVLPRWLVRVQGLPGRSRLQLGQLLLSTGQQRKRRGLWRPVYLRGQGVHRYEERLSDLAILQYLHLSMYGHRVHGSRAVSLRPRLFGASDVSGRPLLREQPVRPHPKAVLSGRCGPFLPAWSRLDVQLDLPLWQLRCQRQRQLRRRPEWRRLEWRRKLRDLWNPRLQRRIRRVHMRRSLRGRRLLERLVLPGWRLRQRKCLQWWLLRERGRRRRRRRARRRGCRL